MSGNDPTDIWVHREGDLVYDYFCSSKVKTIMRGTETATYGHDGSLLTSDALSGTLNQALGYAYNNDFRVSRFTYAGGSVDFTYDNDGLLTKAGSFTVGRNAANGLPETVGDGTLLRSRSFNGYGEVDGESSAVGGADLPSYSLIRDDAGRITSRTEKLGATTIAEFAYTYDDLGRLLTVTKDGVLVEEYQYGPNGARTLERNLLRGITERTMAYSDEDHLLSAGDTTYQYDLDGFLSARVTGTQTTGYTYSSLGELVSVALPDGRLIEYVNDPLGRRIAKKVNGTITEKYLWQGGTRLLAVYDANNNLLMRFLYADGRMPVAMTKAGVTYYLTYDQVGSLRSVVNASGAIVKEIEYDSFGNILSDSNPTLTVPLAFAGGLFDPDTGLVRFGLRDYDPNTGRWTAKDPILFSGGDSNLYGYVHSDPVNFIDPNGLSKTEEIEKGAYRYRMYPGDTYHGGKHWHVYDRKTNELLGRISPSGEVITGTVSKTAIKIFKTLVKIGGVVFFIISELTDSEAAGDPADMIQNHQIDSAVEPMIEDIASNACM